MSFLVRGMVELGGRFASRPLAAALRDPQKAQAQVLKRLLKRNAETSFGREHDFAEITSPKEYAARIAMRDYEGFRPYVQRIEQGESCVLTRETPRMFTTTSGTTAEPKWIPVTKRWLHESASVMRIWVRQSILDHPGALSGSTLSIVSPAIEGYTQHGMPIGSVSGLTYQHSPWVVRRRYAVPYDVFRISDYEARYLILMRLAMVRDVSVLVTPNSSTLLRLAGIAKEYGAHLIRAIHDGALGALCEPGSEREQALYQQLAAPLRPDPQRARELEALLETHGVLSPRHFWPRLALIGAWLGGSCGQYAEKLSEAYGEVPLRDIGYRASEATITVPMRDGDPGGVPALHTAFYEFIPEESIDDLAPPVRLIHELELGKRYYILLTTSAGLYRYDINDIVEVVGFHGEVPLIAFVRKGRDMSNIMGEKLHVDQVLLAMQEAQNETEIELEQFQLIPDLDHGAYDLLIELKDLAQRPSVSALRDAFDRHLMRINVEYEYKRNSGRLGRPCGHLMRSGWAERLWRAEISEGKRDTQYKWSVIKPEWDIKSRAEVMDSGRDLGSAL